MKNLFSYPLLIAITVGSSVSAQSISDMSLDELDQRCEAAREEKLAPLREAEIEKCKQDESKDPEYCERFYSDYGDGGKSRSGAYRPRMFDDLPECVDAAEERDRRG